MYAWQALRGVAEKGTGARNSGWLGASPTLREILEGRLGDAGPSTPRSPFDNGGGPDLATVRTHPQNPALPMYEKELPSACCLGIESGVRGQGSGSGVRSGLCLSVLGWIPAPGLV